MANLNRRNALKFLGAGAIAAGAVGGISELKAGENDDIKSKIVIMGAGLAGISLAAKLRRDMPNAKIVIVDKDEIFYYQPGFTLVGLGFYTKDDVVFAKSEYIPDGVEWIKQNVMQIKPKENKLVLDDSSELEYEYLVVANGVEYEYEAVEGLSLDDINTQSGNISSIYTLEGAIKTNTLMQNFAKMVEMRFLSIKKHR